MSNGQSFVGVGLYSTREAAAYVRASPGAVRNWIFGARGRHPVIRPQFDASDRDRWVTFRDLVELMAIKAFRSRGVALDKIRKGVEKARTKFGVDNPLAMRHVACVYGGELVIHLGGDEYEQLSGKNAGHRMIGKIVETYAFRLEYGNDGYATRYRAWQFDGADVVVLDPRFAFGSPYLPDCGYTASTLSAAADTEGGIDEAAAAYGVDRNYVLAACEYVESLAWTGKE